jgi:hypothetical protein
MLAFVVSALSPAIARDSVAAQSPRLLVAKAELDVGGPEDNPDLEILRVLDAIRTRDGGLLVVNGRPLAIHLFGRDGTWLRSIGHAGGGPGEFEYGAVLRPWTGDSVLVFSRGTRRWLLFSLGGKLVREWPASDNMPVPRTAQVLRGNAIVREGMVGAGGCPSSVLRRLAQGTEGPIQEALVDPAGRLFIRPLTDEDWTVHGVDGRVIASVRFPAGFQALSFDRDVVVGSVEDDDGFPHVVAMGTGLPAAPTVSGADCAAEPLPVPPVRAAQLKTAMRNAMTLAEAYYADHRSYPTRTSDFPRSMIPDRAEFEVLATGERGYVFVVRDRDTGYRCLVSVGAGGIGRLPDGVLLCGA